MKLGLRFASSVLFVGLAACGASRPAVPSAAPAVAPAAAAPVAIAPAKSDGPTVDNALKKVVAFANEAEVRQSLEPRPGEERADRTSALVPKTSTPEERAARAKCNAVREKIIAKNAKLPPDKRFAALVKAFTKSNDAPENRVCNELRDADFARTMSSSRDYRARIHMVELAKGLSQSGLACKGAPMTASKSADLCGGPGAPPDLENDDAWACIGKSLSSEEKESFAIPAYTYAYSVDARLGTYEIVARGCVEGATTELVLRGKIGGSAEHSFIYRRKVS